MLFVMVLSIIVICFIGLVDDSNLSHNFHDIQDNFENKE